MRFTIQIGQRQELILNDTIITMMTSGINQTAITGEATNTGRRITGTITVVENIIRGIANHIIITTGIETGRITGGIKPVGAIITDTMIRIHTGITNIIITIIITGM